MTKSRNTNLFQTLDWMLIAIYFFLIIVGWLNVYGASYNFDQSHIFDFSHRAGKQFVWILTALGLGGIILLLDTRIYDLFSYLIYVLVLFLLLATIFLARDVKGSHSWLIIGPIRFQPAELAKIATALALSKAMSSFDFNIKNNKNFLFVCTIIFIPFAMIILQKETGSALVFLSFVLMFYREGLNGLVLLLGVLMVVLFVLSIGFSQTVIQYESGTWGLVLAMGVVFLIQFFYAFLFNKERKEALWLLYIVIVMGAFSFILNLFYSINYDYVALILALLSAVYWTILIIKKQLKKYWIIVLVTVGSVVFSFSSDYLFNQVLQPHQQSRIKVLLGMDKDIHGAGYNVNQSKIAIGSGGLFGKGYLNGTQTKLKYVPEQATDFIFCTLGEEWGFIGSFVVLLAYLFFLLRIIYIGERQPDNFARIYAYSISGILFFHLFINIGMVIGLMPVIGIPLPFLSYGGSSLWSFTIMLFILLRLDASRFRHMKGRF